MSCLNNKIKEFKLFVLQYRYKFYSEIILNLEKHIEYLFMNEQLDSIQKNQYLGDVFIISKNLNSSYNNYIMEKLDNDTNLDETITEFMELFNNNNNEINNNFLFEQLYNMIKTNDKILPLTEQQNCLTNVIKNVGYYSLIK
jgi:hypothetical protein